MNVESQPIMTANGTNTWTWYQGYATTHSPIHNTQGFCFLTRISGKFQGAGEKAEVYPGIMYDGSDTWVVQGTSQQSGVGAYMMCVAWAELGAASGWIDNKAVDGYITQSTDFTVPLGTHQLCYLGGVSGQFNGGGESVEVVSGPNDKYTLQAAHQSGAGVGARVYCVGLSNNAAFKMGPRVSLSQGSGDRSINITLAQRGFCLLDRFSGKPAGGAEYAGLARNSDTSWTLIIGSHQSGAGMNATAQCIYY